MTLIETINIQLKEAMKTGDVLKRDTLRLLQSALKNSALEKRKDPSVLSDTEVEEVIKRLVKQRKDSILQFQAGNRPDLAEKEESEQKLLSGYLPEAMPEAALRSIVAEALAETGMTEKSQMGQAMGIVMKRIASRASGDDVRRIVSEMLS